MYLLEVNNWSNKMADFSKPLFNPQALSIAIIEQAMINSGYEVDNNNHALANKFNLFFYKGFSKSKEWIYVVAFEDEDSDKRFMYTNYFLSIDKNGLLQCEFDGCPEAHFDTFKELKNAFDALFDKVKVSK